MGFANYFNHIFVKNEKKYYSIKLTLNLLITISKKVCIISIVHILMKKCDELQE